MYSMFIKRSLEKQIKSVLKRGKSLLLLGPRQCGKTTLVEHQIKPDITISFLISHLRRRYEQSPDLLISEIEAEAKNSPIKPLVFIDEVQKVPDIMDAIQYLIDKKTAQFILTGSSARKLRRGHELNLLPGRVIVLHVDPLMLSELTTLHPTLEELLLYGSLPEILLELDQQAKEENLRSYTEIYLEEEIRAEALVRKVSLFSNFLELAASEAGGMINIQKMSQTLGISRTTIQHYFEILEDCLIAEKIEPFIKGSLRQRLSKSNKYLFFDLGIRRMCAGEGTKLPARMMGNLFEQFIGLELLRQTRSIMPKVKICYWRDHNGPEVDYVVVKEQQLIPIEVKWTETPGNADIKHLLYFMEMYHINQGYVICRTPRKMLLNKNIIALSWHDLSEIFNQL